MYLLSERIPGDPIDAGPDLSVKLSSPEGRPPECRTLAKSLLMETFAVSPYLLGLHIFKRRIPLKRTVYPVYEGEELSVAMENDGPPSDLLPPQAPSWFLSALTWLVTAISPARIYQMNRGGTTRRDRYTRVDLLVVLPDSCKDSFSRFDPVLEKVHAKCPAISCSLHRFHQLRTALSNGHLFFSLYCTPSALIYDDRRSPLPLASPFTAEALSGEVWGRFQPLFDRAVYFQETALFHREIHPDSTLSAFFLHQAAEFCLRGVLKSLNGYNKRTHEIRALKQYIRRTAPGLSEIFPESTPEEKRLLTVLDHSYTAARYDQAFQMAREDLDYWARQVALLHEKAPGVISATLRSFALSQNHSG